ncbi:MAG: hypothetical protein HYZ53_13455 [Planctomycetes bacterium]|nr:hypothetical protein [Planctomycetota bacterium]
MGKKNRGKRQHTVDRRTEPKPLTEADGAAPLPVGQSSPHQPPPSLAATSPPDRKALLPGEGSSTGTDPSPAGVASHAGVLTSAGAAPLPGAILGGGQSPLPATASFDPAPKAGTSVQAPVAPSTQPTPPDNLAGCFSRVAWLMLAPCLLCMLLLMIAIDHFPIGSPLDWAYASLACVLLAARRIDERVSRSPQELPMATTPPRFALGFLATALLGLLAAHGIGWLTK